MGRVFINVQLSIVVYSGLLNGLRMSTMGFKF